jgi:hypothetical protein
MAYVFPSTPAGGRRVAFARGRGRLGCGTCRSGLGLAITNTLMPQRTMPLRVTPTSSPVGSVWGNNPTVNNPATSSPRYSGSSYGSSGAASTNRQARRTQRQQQSNTLVNTSGAPSTISSYDKYGNPIYSVPPPGQQVTGYDAAGNPLYGTSSGSVQSTSLSQTSAIVGYDAAGNPIYSSAPPGQTIVSYDSYGNPIYSGSAANASLLTAAQSQAAAAAQPVTAATSESDYQSVLDWFSESTLISGFPNWGVAAAVIGGFMLLQSRMAGRR